MWAVGKIFWFKLKYIFAIKDINGAVNGIKTPCLKLLIKYE